MAKKNGGTNMLKDCDYCDYETCVALKGLGFNALVDWYFNEDKRIVSSLATYRDTYIPRISLYEAQKWLREEKKIEVNAAWDNEKSYWFWYINEMTDIDYFNTISSESIYNSYEEALSEGIKEARKILMEEK